MKNLPTELLRTFVTIVDVGGYTLAGELLGRTQPAISLQVKRLEEIIDKKLIIIKGQKMQLTAEGALLLSAAKKILAINDDIFAQLKEKGVSGQLRLGLPCEFASTLLPKVIGRFVQHYPDIALEVICDLSKNLLSKDNVYDLVLTLHDKPTDGNPLIKAEELVWVGSEHQHAHHNTPVPLVVAPTGCIYRRRLIETLDQANIAWKVVYTIPDLGGITTAIEAGLGITVLARSTVPDTLKILPQNKRLPELGKIGISLIAQKGEQSEALQCLVKYLEASF